MKAVICPGKGREVTIGEYKPKRFRVKCELCGRRMIAAVKFGQDADVIVYYVPPHKIRKWWKKGKRGKDRNDQEGLRVISRTY